MPLLGLFTVLILQAQPIRERDPVALVRQLQQEVDRDGGQRSEREWRAALRARPRDPLATLAVATIERNRYAYERADALYSALLAQRGSDSLVWRGLSRLGRAQWRTLGSDVAAAESLLTIARNDARLAGRRDLEAEIVLALSQLSGRVRGIDVGRELLNTWWSLLDVRTAQDSALWLCQNGVVSDQSGDTAGFHLAALGAGIAERISSRRVAGNCRLAMAQIAARRGYVAGASQLASTALDHFRSIAFAPGIALASQWYGYLKVTSNSYPEGRELLQEAVAAARRTRFESVEAWAYAGLAQHYLELGEAGVARRYAAAAARSHGRRGDLWGLANSAFFEGSALAATGEYLEAITRYAAAFKAYNDARIPHLGIASLVSRAGLELKLGWIDSAERTIEVGRQLAAASDAWRITEEPILRGIGAMRQGQLDQADSLFNIVPLAAQWRRGNASLTAVLMAGREAQLALRSNKMQLADSALQHILGALEVWRDAPRNRGFTASLAQLGSNWATLDELYSDLVDQLIRRGRTSQAFDLIERVRARQVVERQLRVAAPIADGAVAARILHTDRDAGRVAQLSDLRAELARDEAFVTYVLGIDGAPTTALVITRGTANALRMPDRATLRPQIQRFSQLAAAGNRATSISRALSSSLLEPVIASLPRGITRLIISPDGDLHRIPFDALQLSDAKYLIERFTVSIAPSASALFTLRATPSASSSSRLVAVGDPRYAKPRRAAESVDSFESSFAKVFLPRLRYSGAEARRVSRRARQSTTLLGSAATEAALARSLEPGANVLHIASHGLVDDESQFRTAVALAPGAGGDGFLTPDEIAQLNLTGTLVVLSSCRSSAGLVLGGEGVRGLTAPLLEAGARAVVGTHWSIGDRSVIPFVDRMYDALARGTRLDEAVREAKVAAIRSGASIADWASFTITGDGSLRLTLR